MAKTSSNKDLSSLNTFRMKVRAAKYIEFDSLQDIASTDLKSLPRPLLVMGEGSNLLFTGDFAGTVIRYTDDSHDILPERSTSDEVYVKAGAGMKLDELCEWTAKKGWWGLENLSAIPGTVGASAVQNVGAYGVEAGELIDSVECLDLETMNMTVFRGSECAFGYRDSVFKHNRGRYLITAVTYHLFRDFRPQLTYGQLKEEVERNAELAFASADPYKPVYAGFTGPQMPVTPLLVRETVKIIREEKLPDPSKTGSAGSFFKNPVTDRQTYEKVLSTVREQRGANAEIPHYELEDGSIKIPAAFLIDFCGLKGARKGGAAIWEKQPLVIVNANGKATPQDILDLEKKVTDTISATFNITLSPEVDHI